MFKITVRSNKGALEAVYYNKDAERGEMIARMAHGDKVKYIVTKAAQSRQQTRQR